MAGAVLASVSCGGSDRAVTVGSGETDPLSATTPTEPATADQPDDRIESAAGPIVEVDGGDGTDTDDAASAPESAPVLAGAGSAHGGFTLSGESTGFAERVGPLLVDHCASCHNPAGPGASHWYLSTAADVVDVAPFIARELARGSMPPWPASDLGVPYADSLALTDDELADILGWIEAGSLLDVEPTASMTGPTLARLRDPVVVPPLEPYAGDSGRHDDYRCLVYQPDLTEGAWLRGHQFVADRTEVVHHAIGYLVPADQWEAALARDAADPGSGWECFGGTGLAGDTFVMGWAPGQLPEVYPDGTGLWMAPGDFLVVQVHYHYDVRPGPDASSVELSLVPGDLDLGRVTISQFLTPAEIPCGPGEAGPSCDRAVVAAAARAEYGVLPADLINALCGVSEADFAGMTDGTARSSCDLPVRAPGEIVSVLGHMHELGATYRMTLNPGTSEEMVLLDIPDWDYDWQYNYRPADRIVLERGDVLRFECSWERARRDPSLEPAYVLWSFGSDDEMCFSTVVTRPVS